MICSRAWTPHVDELIVALHRGDHAVGIVALDAVDDLLGGIEDLLLLLGDAQVGERERQARQRAVAEAEGLDLIEQVDRRRAPKLRVAIGDDARPNDIAVAFDDRVRTAQFRGLIWIQRGVDAAEHDEDAVDHDGLGDVCGVVRVKVTEVAHPNHAGNDEGPEERAGQPEA